MFQNLLLKTGKILKTPYVSVIRVAWQKPRKVKYHIIKPMREREVELVGWEDLEGYLCYVKGVNDLIYRMQFPIQNMMDLKVLHEPLE